MIYEDLKNDEDFKQVRYRFWKLGRERRLRIIKEMEFNAPEWREKFCEKNEKGEYKENIEMELVQRKILFYIKTNSQEEELIALMEREEAEIQKQDDKAEFVRVTGSVLAEEKPGAEELAQMKFVLGVKKNI